MNAGRPGYVLVDPTPAFRRVLDVTGLADFFGLTEAEVTGT
jgi:anti-anti-sigma regulatory factor